MTDDGPATQPNTTDPAQAWPEVLSDLEARVEEAEHVLARSRADEIAAWTRKQADWTPPSSLGPVPDELRERAARLLQSQLDAAERIALRIMRSQQQRDLAARMSYAPPPVPVFVDEAL